MEVESRGVKYISFLLFNTRRLTRPQRREGLEGELHKSSIGKPWEISIRRNWKASSNGTGRRIANIHGQTYENIHGCTTTANSGWPYSYVHRTSYCTYFPNPIAPLPNLIFQSIISLAHFCESSFSPFPPLHLCEVESKNNNYKRYKRRALSFLSTTTTTTIIESNSLSPNPVRHLKQSLISLSQIRKNTQLPCSSQGSTPVVD